MDEAFKAILVPSTLSIGNPDCLEIDPVPKTRQRFKEEQELKIEHFGGASKHQDGAEVFCYLPPIEPEPWEEQEPEPFYESVPSAPSKLPELCARDCPPRLSANLKQVAAAVVVICTLVEVLLVLAAANGRGFLEPCRVRHDPDQPNISEVAAQADFEYVVLGIPVNIIVAAVTVCLQLNAATQHLRQVARFMLFVWFQSWAALMAHAVQCGTALEPEHRGLLETVGAVVSRIAFLAGAYLLSLLVLGGLDVFEVSSFQKLGTRRAFFIAAGILWVLLLPSAVLRQRELDAVWGVLAWMALLAAAVATARVLAILWCLRRQVITVGKGAPPGLARRSQRAARNLAWQMLGVVVGLGTTTLAFVLPQGLIPLLWPMPDPAPLGIWAFRLFFILPTHLDALGNTFAALILGGVLDGAMHASQADAERRTKRNARWLSTAAKWREVHNFGAEGKQAAWDRKVEDLAGRGVTLDALVRFYRSLGTEWMAHFDPERHTTDDVVWQAILPASAARRSSMSQVLMDGKCTRPQKVVTHNWSNLFRDLLAAIIADALEEEEFANIAFQLQHDIGVLERWIAEVGVGSKTYWVCAFSVNQHLGHCKNICRTSDSVTGKEHPACQCKTWYKMPPAKLDGRSIQSETNKFPEMLHLLSSGDPAFGQLVAADASFRLFSRLWCASEIAAAHTWGMPQSLVLQSVDGLEGHRPQLQSLRVEDMEASRSEDKEAIMSDISDVERFDQQLQTILFEELLPAYSNSEAAQEAMTRVGRIARWTRWRGGAHAGTPVTKSASASSSAPSTDVGSAASEPRAGPKPVDI